MADLASHLLVNWIGGVRFVDRTSLGWFVSGALLPDLSSRVPRVLLDAAVQQDWLVSSTTTQRLMLGLDFPHTPLGIVLTGICVSLLVPERFITPPGRQAVALLLGLGGLLHLGVDLMQLHLSPGYRLLYPLTLEAWELGWVSTEATLAAVPLLALVAWFLTQRTGGRPEGRPPGGS